MEERSSIQLHVCGQNYFIWNLKDAEHLRLEHRIVGKFIGTMDGLAHQNQLLTIPLLLMKEEARLLIERQLVSVHSIRLPNKKELARRHKEMEDERCHLLIDYQNAFLRHTEEKLRENADQLVKSARKKLHLTNDQTLNVEQVIQERLQLIKKPDLNEIPYLLQRECTDSNLQVGSNELPLFESEREKFNYQVYQKLYDLNFYLTSGLKFGCDYLAYKYDPIIYHSSFIVICILNAEELNEIQVLGYTRLASQVKKSVLLAINRIEGDQQSIELMTIEWKSGRNDVKI